MRRVRASHPAHPTGSLSLSLLATRCAARDHPTLLTPSRRLPQRPLPPRRDRAPLAVQGVPRRRRIPLVQRVNHDAGSRTVQSARGAQDQVRHSHRAIRGLHLHLGGAIDGGLRVLFHLDPRGSAPPQRARESLFSSCVVCSSHSDAGAIASGWAAAPSAHCSASSLSRSGACAPHLACASAGVPSCSGPGRVV
jgi:hypothetical protein